MNEAEHPGPGPAPTEAASVRTGLFFCGCAGNLGTVVELGDLAQRARWPEAAEVATHAVLCSAEGRTWLGERIQTSGLDRVVIAACSPREHEGTFRGVLASAGLGQHALQMVNLREQVEWIGGDPAAATARAARLVRAGLARVALHRPIAHRDVEVSPDVLVVGGGAAGISAALGVAQKRRKAVLVERELVLGGLANQLDRIFPNLECASCFMEPVLDRVLHHERIEVLTGAEVARVRGTAGRFEVEIAVRPRRVDPAACLGCGACASACPVEVDDPFAGGFGKRKAIHLAYPGCLPHVSAVDEAACLGITGGCSACIDACAVDAIRLDQGPSIRRLEVGAIVVATGLAPGAAGGPDGVVTTYQVERLLHPNGPTGGDVRGAGGRTPRSVLLGIEGADGPDAALGAREILKLAGVLATRLPSSRVSVAGGLGRAPDLGAEARAVAAAGVELLDAGLVPGGLAAGSSGVSVRLRHGGTELIRTADLVVVHRPARPAEGSEALARLLRIAADARGFMADRAASPFEATATRVAGIHVAGAAAGPRSIPEAIRDGMAAAGLVLASLEPGERRAVEPLAAEVDAALCGGCGICEAACPFGAMVMAAEAGQRRARVEAIHCRGCGTCAAACPTGAVVAHQFTHAQIAAEISALLADGTIREYASEASAPGGASRGGEGRREAQRDPADGVGRQRLAGAFAPAGGFAGRGGPGRPA